MGHSILIIIIIIIIIILMIFQIFSMIVSAILSHQMTFSTSPLRRARKTLHDSSTETDFRPLNTHFMTILLFLLIMLLVQLVHDHDPGLNEPFLGLVILGQAHIG